jgi:hypothetical protein
MGYRDDREALHQRIDELLAERDDLDRQIAELEARVHTRRAQSLRRVWRVAPIAIALGGGAIFAASLIVVHGRRSEDLAAPTLQSSVVGQFGVFPPFPPTPRFAPPMDFDAMRRMVQGSRPSPEPDACDANDKQSIRRIAEGFYEIDSCVIDEVLEYGAATRALRVVPSLDGGGGLRLYGIRPASAVDRLGFENGDVLVSVNGVSVATPDSALNAYGRYRSDDSLTAALLRRGKPTWLHFRVVRAHRDR